MRRSRNAKAFLLAPRVRARERLEARRVAVVLDEDVVPDLQHLTLRQTSIELFVFDKGTWSPIYLMTISRVFLERRRSARRTPFELSIRTLESLAHPSPTRSSQNSTRIPTLSTHVRVVHVDQGPRVAAADAVVVNLRAPASHRSLFSNNTSSTSAISKSYHSSSYVGALSKEDTPGLRAVRTGPCRPSPRSCLL